MKLYLIIRGKWRTPNHSNKRSEDDTHKVKEEIYKAVGRRNFSGDVGSNPDIDVDDKTGKIILRGKGPFWKKTYPTSLPADDFFILCFSCIKDAEETEVSLLLPQHDTPEKEHDSSMNIIRVNDDLYLDDVYLVPEEDSVLSALIGLLFKMHCRGDRTENKYILVLLRRKDRNHIDSGEHNYHVHITALNRQFKAVK